MYLANEINIFGDNYVISTMEDDDDYEIISNGDDWESENYVVPTITANQQKQIDDRKMVEETDNALTKELFNTIIIDTKIEDTKIIVNPTPIISLDTSTKVRVSNRAKNENKQKEFSNKIKEKKNYKRHLTETFGEPEGDYQYDEFEDKFSR